MHESVCQVTIIGEQKDPCCVSVKSPNWVYAFTNFGFDHIHDRLATLFITGCRNGVFGFVHKHVFEGLKTDGNIVNNDEIGGHDTRSKFGYDLTIHFHFAGYD
jgi:hypothetical protein